ncbi:hypothetical protein JTE90_021432 [Oedothorax gibbosus]|uniref:Uncharacterized protein n=1 Tax=Oedothorax gibbosus TaxID=931172 RepID=A0AAV6VXR4_9ARAC|nr:hypothetical protein JTE90_021432 [Oedothorax gibbosus]
MVVVLNHAEYHKKLIEGHDFPTAIVLLEANEIKDCAVVYGKHFIQCPQLSIISLLTLLLGVYFTMEINYPKEHVQAMGALALLVINDNF